MSRARPRADRTLIFEALASAPLPLAVAALWAFALARGGGYYLLGRLSRGTPGGRMDAWAERVTKGYVTVAEARVARLGARAIIVGYPIYGVSAATQVVSGGLRMRLPSFYLALGVVSLPYAVLQAVVGLAALRAIVIGYGSWVLGIAVVVGLVWWLWRRRRHGAPPREPGPPAAA